MAKRKAEEMEEPDLDDPNNTVEFIPLGAGQEVGRSCMILRYRGKSVMLDCGIHPGFAGTESLPFFDAVDMDQIDVALITHFHLDHCAALPYLVGHTNFKGRIFMTHPTKAIYGTLLKDFVKVSRGSQDEALYKDKDLDASMERTEVMDFHQTIDIDGIKVTAYRAGHVLGAAMFMVEIAGMRLLYTGDYSRLADRHLSAADVPEVKPHIVVVEATYGVSRHLPRDEREKRFVDKVRAILARGGRVLLPVVALGRAQEILLILEEYWQRNPEMHNVPIYQASGLARRAMSIYQTYIEMMNDDIKTAFQRSNPFVFKHIKHLKSPKELDDIGPCVVMATPSMLQSGLSRELFEAWVEDSRNGVIIADFAVQGTLAREILGEPDMVMRKDSQKVKLRMSVDAISFSAHADFPQTSEFIDLLKPPHVVLVHGEASEMMRLKKALQERAKNMSETRTLYTPKVTQPVKIFHKAQRLAKVVGRMADKPAHQGGVVRGLLVRQGGSELVMHPDDLPIYTKLHPGRIIQRQAIMLQKPFAEVRLALEVMFEGVEGSGALGGVSGQPTPGGAQGEILRVADAVTLTYKPAGTVQAAQVLMEWESGPIGDLVSDAVIAVILQTSGEPASLSKVEARRQQALEAGDEDAATAAEMQIMATVLNSQFGRAQIDEAQGLIMVEVDAKHVIVDHKNGKVECSDEALKGRVEKAVQRLVEAMSPCAVDEAD
ncbi:hypothetical protein WJX72_007682 [[Myrmecia] bisecta]|uniref:Cleavage and polyadenylation specificity factor subunit 3 n=1 Tax=[Myrmecia] bisecta TaxID=41462 RepID=A0AAW1PT63_9CHLO